MASRRTKAKRGSKPRPTARSAGSNAKRAAKAKMGRPKKHPEDVEVVQTTVRLPADLHAEARIECFRRRVSLTDLLADLLRRELQK